MIELLVKSPKIDTVIFTDKISVNYEVKDTDGVFDKVIFEVFDRNDPQTSNFLLARSNTNNLQAANRLLPTNIRKFYLETDVRRNLFEVPNLVAGDYVLIAIVENKYGKQISSTEKRINFSTKPVTLDLKNKLSSVVESTIPEFLRTDYEYFTDFIKYYYKWLEETKNVNYIPHNLEQYFDVDNIPPELIDTFYKTYLNNFPTQFTKDKETNSDIDIPKILKRIRDFYSKKGTEDSFRFVFRVMFDTEITFSYPREKVIYASQGKWKTDKFIRTKNLSREEVTKIIGTELYVENENGERTFSGIISDTYSTIFNGITTNTIYLTSVLGSLNSDVVYYDEVVLGVSEQKQIKLCSMIVDNDWADCPADLFSFISSDISPAFEPVASQRTGFKVGEIVKLSLLGDNLQFSCVPPGGCESSPADLNGDGKVTGADLGIILGAWGVNPGHPADFNGDGKISGSDLGTFLGYYSGCSPCNANYSQSTYNGVLGTGFFATVKEVNERKQITKIKIIDPGINYTEENITHYNTEILKEDGTIKLYNCRLIFKFGYMFTGEPYYENFGSVLGYFSVMPDNYYYQSHSYEIGSSVTPFKFADILKTTVHPAGYLPFYRYDILDTIVEKPATEFTYNQSGAPAFVSSRIGQNFSVEGNVIGGTDFEIVSAPESVFERENILNYPPSTKVLTPDSSTELNIEGYHEFFIDTLKYYNTDME